MIVMVIVIVIVMIVIVIVIVMELAKEGKGREGNVSYLHLYPETGLNLSISLCRYCR